MEFEENNLGGDEAISLADEEIASYVSRARTKSLENIPALSAFQKRMDQYPQLSSDAQLELVQAYQRGLVAKEELAELNGSVLEFATKRKLHEKIKRADYAIEHLVGSNFKLVWLIVREQAEDRYGPERAGELLPDMVSEANAAVVEAVRDYDPARCPTFATYLARVVRDRVRMILTKEGPLRLSPSWSRLKRIASYRIPALTTELGRTPTKEEIQADLLDKCLVWASSKLSDEQKTLSEKEQYDVMIGKLRKQGMLGAIRDIDDVLIATQSMASLDSPVGTDIGGATLGDLLPGKAHDSLFDSLELSELSSVLKKVLESLPGREKEIILYRFGFVDGDTWTYAKIAEKYNVTAERIRQIERNILAKLSGNSGSLLTGFLPGGK